MVNYGRENKSYFILIMKVLYLINKIKYNYHLRILGVFLEIIPGDVFDMSDGTELSARYYQIENYKPDVIITFDLAGFELRTGNDTLSLNNIYARMAHILFGKPDQYGNDLKARQNLSMFTYLPDGTDIASTKARYDQIPNISNFVPFDRNADNESDIEKNRRIIKTWWDEFKTEAMLG